jgi:glutamate formiminotransferase/formiminotetrahydrofolate cyclodeaminase
MRHSTALVECVPNFSEGRNAETVRALVAAVTAVEGVVLLDEEQDRDHHRAVVTFAGSPEAVIEAAFQAARVAAERIDLRQHQGGHPRVGATDVIPFVPIRDVTMEDCIALAKKVGARIGAELNVPVFLYERAATRPDRAQLENIRRGGLEGLGLRMREPGWAPDFGPAVLHPTAGATVVGARPPLVAYNVNLHSSNLDLAKAIAKKVRQSSGGLPHVKAIGVELTSRHIVQVSMNLTNHDETPIHAAFEAVREEAERQGVRVAGSEVIGLVPQRALVQAAEFFLKLEGFDGSQVLETRLERALAQQSTRSDQSPSSAHPVLDPFIDAVAAGTPTPGGGSVAAMAGVLASSLGIMGCRIGLTGSAGDRSSLHTAENHLLELRERLLALVDADAKSYETVLQAYRLPKTDPERPEKISQGLQVATEVPLETAALACDVATLLRAILLQTKASVSPDLRVGLFMAIAAMEGAILNVDENLKTQKNHDFINIFQGKVDVLKERLVELKRL